MRSTIDEDYVDQYRDWIGRTESIVEHISVAHAAAAAATFDVAPVMCSPGAALPALWHWFYFLPRAPHRALDEDGHPARGGFFPPVPYPRRMFAGARMRVHQPLRVGHDARRDGEIRDVVLKTGRSGSLAFVTVGYRISQDGVLCIEEEQDIVYREIGSPSTAPTVAPWTPLPEGAWSRIVSPDARVLFRFSALTFNAHRIHYDREYARAREGYPGLVVHGPMTAMLLLDLAAERGSGPVVDFSFRGMAPLFDLAPFRLVATGDARTVSGIAEAPDGTVALRAEVSFA